MLVVARCGLHAESGRAPAAVQMNYWLWEIFAIIENYSNNGNMVRSRVMAENSPICLEANHAPQRPKQSNSPPRVPLVQTSEECLGQLSVRRPAECSPVEQKWKLIKTLCARKCANAPLFFRFMSDYFHSSRRAMEERSGRVRNFKYLPSN